MTQTDCEECCGEEINHPFLGTDDVSFYEFYQGPDCTIILVFIKNNQIHMMISKDCGKTFEKPNKITDLEGKMKFLKILSNNEQFVIAMVETIGGKDCKKAVSGFFETPKKAFTYKQCERFDPPSGKINSISCGFRPMKDNQGQIESVDYVFVPDPIDPNKTKILCQGHGCIIK